MARKIVWNKRPSKYLAKELRRISEESYSNADIVETAIMSKLATLCEQPESSPPDKYKLNNEGNRFRAFETHSFRVAYRFTENEIRVLRVRSTHQEPKMY